MSQRYAVLVFLVAVLVLCAGAYVVGRLILPAGQTEFRPRPAWTPPGASSPAGQPSATPAAGSGSTHGTPGRTTTPATRAAITPARGSTAEPAGMPTQTSSPTPTTTATPTPEATAAAFAFELARPVRHSSGDCPGSYILGRVTDAQGGPLANVRLTLSNEYGNQQVQTTKTGASEVGRYDFPLFGAQGRFYLSVVDAQGRPLSPAIEVPHGVGASPQATCHWVDWQQR